MGGSSSKEETSEEETNNGTEEESSGFHIIEIHAPTVGFGILTLVVLCLALLVGWCLYKRYRQNFLLERRTKEPPMPFMFQPLCRREFPMSPTVTLGDLRHHPHVPQPYDENRIVDVTVVDETMSRPLRPFRSAQSASRLTASQQDERDFAEQM